MNNKITNTKTISVKTFASGKNVMQVRAGKFGDDKVFITYMDTTTNGGNGYGNVPKGTKMYQKELLHISVYIMLQHQKK